MPDCCSIEPQGCGSSGGSVDASMVTFTPAVPSDWSPAPSDVAGALDQEAARIKALEASTPVPQIYSCPSGAAVNDPVYLSGSGAVDIADATDRAKMPAIGFIASKPTATNCILQDEDELAGFGTLTPGARYWIGAGGISTSPPAVDGNSVEQQAGFAKTADILKIELGVSPEANI